MKFIKKIFHWCKAVTAVVVYGFPARKLYVIGVTGTDGKTTTCSLIAHILETAGYSIGLQTTLSSLHTTTQDPFVIQKFLADCVANRKTHVVLEVTSHAIDQFRVLGCQFRVGILTNIADNEHLDYHKSFLEYKKTKLSFLKKCPVVIANADDSSIVDLKSFTIRKLVTYGLRNPADYSQSLLSYKHNVLGEFNKYNMLAAISLAKILLIDSAVIGKALKTFALPAGRLQVILESPCKVIVDFAHTPQAFSKVLPEIKKLIRGKGRLIHVFGATGNRFTGKRAILSAIACDYDSVILLTHEDTYNENVAKIITDLEKGINMRKFKQVDVSMLNSRSEKVYCKIFDRKNAIEAALKIVHEGDIVLLTGVGHQKTLNLNGKEVSFIEEEIVKNAVSKLNQT